MDRAFLPTIRQSPVRTCLPSFLLAAVRCCRFFAHSHLKQSFLNTTLCKYIHISRCSRCVSSACSSNGANNTKTVRMRWQRKTKTRFFHLSFGWRCLPRFNTDSMMLLIDNPRNSQALVLQQDLTCDYTFIDCGSPGSSILDYVLIRSIERYLTN